MIFFSLRLILRLTLRMTIVSYERCPLSIFTCFARKNHFPRRGQRGLFMLAHASFSQMGTADRVLFTLAHASFSEWKQPTFLTLKNNKNAPICRLTTLSGRFVKKTYKLVFIMFFYKSTSPSLQMTFVAGMPSFQPEFLVTAAHCLHVPTNLIVLSPSQ